MQQHIKRGDPPPLSGRSQFLSRKLANQVSAVQRWQRCLSPLLLSDTSSHCETIFWSAWQASLAATCFLSLRLPLSVFLPAPSLRGVAPPLSQTPIRLLSVWSSILSFASGEEKPVSATNSTDVTTKSRDQRRDLAAAVCVDYDSNVLTWALFHRWHDGCDAFDVNLEQITSLHGKKTLLGLRFLIRVQRGTNLFFMIVSSWFSLLRRLLHCRKKHFHWSKSSASELETTFVVCFFFPLFLFDHCNVPD